MIALLIMDFYDSVDDDSGDSDGYDEDDDYDDSEKRLFIAVSE